MTETDAKVEDEIARISPNSPEATAVPVGPLQGAWPAIVRWMSRYWRWLAVAASLPTSFLALFKWARATEVGYVAKYVSLTSITFLDANWYVVLIDIALAAICAVFSLSPRAREASVEGWPGIVRQALVFADRQFAHVDALLPWVVVVAAKMPVAVVLPSVTAVILLGPVSWEAIAAQSLVKKPKRPYWSRRPAEIVCGIVGMAMLFLLSIAQAAEIANLFGLLVVAASLRLGPRLWLGLPGKESPAHAEATGRQAVWARRLDWLGALIAAGLILGNLPALFKVPTEAEDLSRRRLQLSPSDPPPPSPKDSLDSTLLADSPPSASSGETVGLFIVADSQFHELRGAGFGGQMDLVESVISVAVRPVELDLLSGATLGFFAQMYREMKKTRPTLRWAHLGDFGDLGCATELDRFRVRYLEAFGAEGLAGLAPGNHDSAFTGNFAWHPDWDGACASFPKYPDNHQTKLEANERLFAMGSPVWSHLVAHTLPAVGKKSALVTVSPLGEADGTVVLGAFLDTSDYTGFTLGAQGAEGAVSPAQVQAAQGYLREAIADAEKDAKKARIVLFLHHPFDVLSPPSKEALRGMDPSLLQRVVGIVSAHTHLAAERWQLLGGRRIPELVVGSTIDPPQEAALLEVGPFDREPIPFRLHTLPAIDRPGMTGALGPHGIDAADCTKIMETLRREQSPNCGALFRDQPLALVAQHPSTPEDVKALQQGSARRLLTCLCRDQRCPHIEHHRAEPLFTPELYEDLDALFFEHPEPDSREIRKELVCISWAASILQGRKSEQWELDRALRDGFERAATFGAMDLPRPQDPTNPAPQPLIPAQGE